MNEIVRTLLLIRLGQELGADTSLARAVAAAIDAALRVAAGG